MMLGYSRRVSFAGAQPDFEYAEAPRCPAVRFDVQCQLEAGHHADRHIAMVTHASSRRRGYSLWTRDGWSAWTGDLSSVGPQPWAVSFPRVA